MIVSEEYLRTSEQQTMTTEPISSLDLMERAATTLTQQLSTDLPLNSAQQILVFCGPGNNGGDGLVVARLLAKKNLPVTAVITTFHSTRSTDFNNNYQRLQTVATACDNLQLIKFEEFSENPPTAEAVIAIDALFGIGLSRPLQGDYAAAVDFINAQSYYVAAVDVPSGLFIDKHTPPAAHRVRAHRTYTFQWYKWAFLLPETEAFVGDISVLDIGLQEVTTKILPYAHWISKKEIARLFLPMKKFSHKGTNGHGLLIAGSKRMPGAAILSATAALRSGIGKVTLHSTANVAAAIATARPEAIVSIDQNEESVSRCDWQDLGTINAIAIGPGIGQSARTAALLKDLLSEVAAPIIFDADALNLLAANKTWLAYLPKGSILTPHFKEFSQLFGNSNNDFERISLLRSAAQKYEIVIVLKGANSIIAMPDGKLFVNPTGNPGMATAGSGDVLTGMILSFLAKGYAPPIAAILGTYLHGAAGDHALKTEAPESLIASDICQNIGKAIGTIRG